LAEAVRSDGSRFPWAVRPRSLTYLGENPFPHSGLDDRGAIFADLLFDALAPTTAARHRALVPLEDVRPDADPRQQRTIADYLSNRHLPFSVGVYPMYTDPLGGQFFPYVVKDVYGAKVLPENLANYQPVPENNNTPRLLADIVATARRNLAVRNGFASFFYHPYLGLPALKEIVSGIKGLGYTFVDAGSL